MQKSRAKILISTIVVSVLLTAASVLICSSTLANAATSESDKLYGEELSSRGMSVKNCPNITAQYACLVKKNGEVVYERSSYDHAKIASLTKIMTAVVALENSDLEDTVTITQKAYDLGESSAGVWPDDKLDMKTALIAMLVPSGNDAAESICQMIGQRLVDDQDERIRLKSKEEVSQEARDREISEDEVKDVFETDNEKAFVMLMNQKAWELGCENTSFTNPHGLADDEFASDEQYSCAMDICMITKYAMENEYFRKVVATGDTTITVDRNGTQTPIEVISTDILVGNFEGCIGVKTGNTDIGGPCFSGACVDSDGEEFYTVVLKSEDETVRFVDTQNLFNWYLMNKIKLDLTDTNVKETMYEGKENEEEVGVVAYLAHSEWVDCTFPVTLREEDRGIPILAVAGNVHMKTEPEEIKGSFRAGDKVAELILTQHNREAARVDLIAVKDQPGPNIFQMLGVAFDRLCRNIAGEKTVAETDMIANCDKINELNERG